MAESCKKNPDDPGRDAWETGDRTKIGGNERILARFCEYPLKKSLPVTIFAVVFIIVMGYISYYIIPSYFTPVFVLIFLVVSNASFFMRSSYTLTEEKLIVDRIIYRKAYPWSRFRGYCIDKNGIFLSPSSNPERFDRFRGVFLVMSRENMEKAESVLKEIIHGPSDS